MYRATGYIKVEGDPTVPSHVKNISTTDISNWNGKQEALGFTPENVTNKASAFSATPADVKYPTEKLVKDNLDLKANDNAVVHLTGNETVAGVKNFTDNQIGANISQLNMGTCDTEQATTLKEVTLEGYVPKQGDTVKVLMTNASVASASLRVNGGTTYEIRNNTTATSTSSWSAGDICEFVFDGTYAFLFSRKPASSTTTRTIYSNLTGSATSSTSATYSTGGIIGVNTLSDTNDNTNKWAYFGYFTLTYNATYSSGMSINHCFLFTEYSRLNSDVSVNDLEAFQVQVKVNLEGVTSSSLFNSAVPNIAINITGKTNLTSSDFCALVYSTTTSAKVIRLYVKLKTPNKHYGFLPICYGNNAYRSTGAISTGYISWTSASVQALISDLPTPAQGAPVFATIYPNYGSNTGDETNESIKTKLGTDLTNKALDNTVVHKTGNETIGGIKTFSSPIVGSGASLTNLKTNNIENNSLSLQIAGVVPEALSNGVYSKIIGQTIIWDDFNNFNPSTQTITIPTTGKYSVIYIFNCNITTANTLNYIQLWKNGTSVGALPCNGYANVLTGAYSFNANDKVTFYFNPSTACTPFFRITMKRELI